MRNQNPPESGHTYCFTVPEWVAKRITRHYPDGIPSKAMRPFWRRMKNPAYKRHIFERLDDILMETLDETSTEPARLSRNPVEALLRRDIHGVVGTTDTAEKAKALLDLLEKKRGVVDWKNMPELEYNLALTEIHTNINPYWIRWKIVFFWKIPGKKNCRYLLRVLQEGRTRDFTQPSRFATWFDFWTDGDYQPENNQRSPLGSVVHQLT